MQTKSNHHSIEFLLNQAAECAECRLQQKGALKHAFLFAEASWVGVAWAEPDGSADPIQNFVAAMRHLAIAKNVKAGVFMQHLDHVSVTSPGNCPASLMASEYVLMVWQSRSNDLTVFFPVHRNADGAFCHLGQFSRAKHLPWIPNIIPQQEPDASQSLASEILLRKYELKIEMQPTMLTEL